MKTGKDIFDAAMGLMDELDREGRPDNPDTEEYARRAPGILNMMVAEYRILAGEKGGILPLEALEEPVLRIPDVYAVGVMHYGLAANLLVDENPAAAGFYEQRYEELRNIYFTRFGAEPDAAVEDLYGGIEFGQFGRW